MSFRYNSTTLKKIETLYEEISYSIRFEKGNFNSGYCVLEERKIVVVNKFLTIEGRINALLDLLSNLAIDENKLSSENKKVFSWAQKIPVE
jgi:hypothetical protein